MKAELIPINGDPPIPIERDLTLIGRREFCDVRIDHHGLSKRHCVVVKTDGLLVIRDLATTNGTKVNGQRIRWAALLPNDRLTIGGYKMKVYLGPDTAPSPSELAGAARTPPRGDDPSIDPEAPGMTAPPIRASDVVDEDATEAPDAGQWRDMSLRNSNGEPYIIELD